LCSNTKSIFDPATYDALKTHPLVFAPLGAGEPSKMSKEEFLKIDKQAVLDFARICKKTEFNILSFVFSGKLAPLRPTFEKQRRVGS
jgi:hypothetical protein